MSTPLLVGFCGPAHVGKSTTAQRLAAIARQHGYHGVAMAFADPLYDMLAAMTGRSVEWLKANKSTVWTKENAPAKCLIGSLVRHLFQIVGTECVRNQVHPDFWVDRLVQRAHDAAQNPLRAMGTKGTIVFIEDVRFENEAGKCHTLIELRRDGIGYANDHVSAKQLDMTSFPRSTITVERGMNYDELFDIARGPDIRREKARG